MSETRLLEVQWTFRRLFTYAVTAVLLLLVGFVIWRTNDGGALKAIGLALCALIALQSFFYIGGATMTDIWRVIAAMRGQVASKGEPS